MPRPSQHLPIPSASFRTSIFATWKLRQKPWDSSLLVLRAGSDRELEEAFVSIAQHGAGGLFLNGSPFFASRRDLVLALAARHRIPTIWGGARRSRWADL